MSSSSDELMAGGFNMKAKFNLSAGFAILIALIAYEPKVGATTISTIQQALTGRCLDSDGASVYTLPCNGNNFQKWTLNGDGSVQHRLTGRCLDSNGTSVYMLPCNGNNFQKWAFTVTTDGAPAGLYHPLTDRCLDSDGIPSGSGGSARVYPLPCYGNNFQKWAEVLTVFVDGPSAADLLGNCAVADSCTFTPFFSDTYNGPDRIVSRVLKNCGVDDSHNLVSWSDTTGSSNSVNVSFSVGVKFADVFDASIQTTYGHTWETSHTNTGGVTIDLMPRTIGWVTMSPTVQFVIGRYEMNFSSLYYGHYKWWFFFRADTETAQALGTPSRYTTPQECP
jgi:hypothetical protein